MRSVVLLVVFGCVLSIAGAQVPYWSDNFDPYPLGQLASGTGGWYGWDNVSTVIGDIVDPTLLTAPFPALSGAHCLEINTPDDTIQPFVLNDPTGYPTSGFWRMTGWWYIPSGPFVSGSLNQFFLIQNSYNHGGPYTWTVQLEADPTTMMVNEYHTFERVNYTVPVVLDQWVVVQADMDLDHDRLKLYYNNVLVCEGRYTSAAGQVTEIACLDLFTTSTTNVAYWDDLKLEQVTPDFQVNQTGASLDVNGLTNDYFKPIVALIQAGTPASLNLQSLNAGMPWDIAFTTPEPSVPVSGGGFATGGGQSINIDLTAPSLGTLNPPFPFANAALPLSLPTIQITAQMLVVDPALADGLALSAANEITAVGCQNPQNFDAFTTGTGVYPFDWSDGGGGAQWAIHTGKTSSATTGPTAANSPANYMYAETSGAAGTATFKVNTCTFSTAGIPIPTLNFALSRIGATIGTLVVRQDDGSGTFPIVLATYVGPDPNQMQGLVEWSSETLPVDTTTPGAIPAFQFDYTAGGDFRGDIAIDDVQVM